MYAFIIHLQVILQGSSTVLTWHNKNLQIMCTGPWHTDTLYSEELYGILGTNK